MDAYEAMTVIQRILGLAESQNEARTETRYAREEASSWKQEYEKCNATLIDARHQIVELRKVNSTLLVENRKLLVALDNLGKENVELRHEIIRLRKIITTFADTGNVPTADHPTPGAAPAKQ